MFSLVVRLHFSALLSRSSIIPSHVSFLSHTLSDIKSGMYINLSDNLTPVHLKLTWFVFNILIIYYTTSEILCK